MRALLIRKPWLLTVYLLAVCVAAFTIPMSARPIVVPALIALQYLLLAAFRKLLAKGGTVLIIEHNLDVIKCADWIVDLGPEGGEGGGQIVAEGTPEQVAACPGSYTGRFLARVLEPPD